MFKVNLASHIHYLITKLYNNKSNLRGGHTKGIIGGGRFADILRVVDMMRKFGCDW